MAKHRVCPWWLGYLLASPLRRLLQDPAAVVSPHVQAGMTILEPGPGMGFFTLEMARLAGSDGKVIAVDLQLKMLEGLKRRVRKAGLLDRVETRVAREDSLDISDLDGRVDFALAFAMVHEMPSAATFFAEVSRALKPGAHLLLAEPSGHVDAAAFDEELKAAAAVGLEPVSRPAIRKSHAALLRRI